MTNVNVSNSEIFANGNSKRNIETRNLLVSTYVECERLSVMHKQVSVHIPQTVNFCPNSPESHFWNFRPESPPPPPKMKNFRFEMTKVYSKIYPPPPKLKFSHFLALWVFSVLAPYPSSPPPWKLKFSHFLALWVFSVLAPSPPKKLKFSHFLSLWVFSVLAPFCSIYLLDKQFLISVDTYFLTQESVVEKLILYMNKSKTTTGHWAFSLVHY